VDVGLRSAYAASFAAHRRCQSAFSAFTESLATALKQRDFWTFQLQELERVDPQPGEYEDLKRRRERIRHAASLGELYRLLDAELSGADDSIAQRLSELEQRLERASGMDPGLSDWIRKLAEARLGIEELGASVSRRMLDDDGSPEALEALEKRLHALYRLQQKFSGSLEDAIQEREKLTRRLRDLADAERRTGELKTALGNAEVELDDAAKALHEARAKGARRLVSALHQPLAELGLGDDPISIEHQMLSRESWTEGGPDRVELMLAANPREEPKPLARIASGGELSRVMLALKSVLPGGDRVGTLVFDEIDSGIGGETAARVARRLGALAKGRQVIVITHLHPIAASAEHHWEVAKRSVAGRHVPSVRVLSDRERVEALGRLIGGGQTTRESRAAARTLVQRRRRD
jgi:DNA repair protein RecN (Recombination protein N)